MQSAMWKSSPEEWADQFRTNSTAPYFVTVAFLHLLAKAAKKGDGSGCVRNVDSVAAHYHNPFHSLPGYSLSTAGADHRTRLLAAKFQNVHVRVNSVDPGYFPR